MQRVFGFAEQGDTNVLTMGHNSTNVVQGSFPYATITVFVAGTTSLATIYSDNHTTPTPLANPFTADENGYWFFYAANGRYDVRISGVDIVCPWTLGDVMLYDSSADAGKQYNWTQDVQANGFNIIGAGNVGAHCLVLNGAAGGPIQLCAAPGGSLQISDSSGTGLAWVTPQGNLDITGQYMVNGVPLSLGGIPAGSNGQIQYNDNGAFGASPDFVWVGDKLGIGTDNPFGPNLVVIRDKVGGQHGIKIEHIGADPDATTLYFWKQRGTDATPLPVQVDDWLMYIGWGGFSSNYPTFNANQGAIAAKVTSPSGMADLIFFANDGTDLIDNGPERMRITSTGNVIISGGNLTGANLIGATSTLIAPQVWGNSFLLAGTGGNEQIRISPFWITWYGPGALARWSINRTDPELGGNSGSNLHVLRYDDAGAGVGPGGEPLGGQPVIVIRRNNGNVGINTDNPQYQLHIVGDCNLSAGSVYRINGVPIAAGGGTATALISTTGPPAPSSIAINEMVIYWNAAGPSLNFNYRAPTGQLYQGIVDQVGPIPG